MNGQNLPLGTIAIVVLSIIVLAAVGIFFMHNFGQATSQIDVVQNVADEMILSMT